MSDYKFKGTPAPWFAEHYANYINIQPKEGYVDNKGNPVKNLLDIEDCPEAVHNGHLVAAAPDLLQAALNVLKYLPSIDSLPRTTETEIGNDTKGLIAAIEKALNINQTN